MKNTKRFAIIGAGISGIYAAHQLKKTFPASKIDIYDKSQSAGGATRDKCLFDETTNKELILPNGTHYTGNGGEIGPTLIENGVELLYTSMEEYSANNDKNGGIMIIRGSSSPKLAETENIASVLSFQQTFSEKLLPLSLENYLKIIWGDRAQGVIANLEKKIKIKFSNLSALSKYTLLLSKFIGCNNSEESIHNSIQNSLLVQPKQKPLSACIPKIGWSKSLKSVIGKLYKQNVNIYLVKNISLSSCKKIGCEYVVDNTKYTNIVWRANPNEVIKLASQKFVYPKGWHIPKRYITHCITHDLENFKPGAYLMDYTDKSSIIRIHRTPYEKKFSVLTIESFTMLSGEDYTHLKNTMGAFSGKSISIRTINEYSFNDFSLIPLGYEVAYARSVNYCNGSHPNLLVTPGLIYGKEQIAAQIKLMINNLL